MMWKLSSSGIIVRYLAAGAALAAAMPLALVADAQEPVQLTMEGEETLDPKERISGDAAVGINFILPGNGGGSGKKSGLQLDAVYAYFYDEPHGVLQTTLTTVDGRYFAEFETSYSGNLKNDWAKLTLTRKDGQPLNTDFLERNYDKDREIAILVTDSSKPAKSFPVRWGEPCATDKVRIRVNAEGADAYVVRFVEKPGGNRKGTLARCAEASDKSQFKFDYNCDMQLADIAELETLQVIRKRGSTYEKPIPIALAAFTRETANKKACSAD